MKLNMLFEKENHPLVYHHCIEYANHCIDSWAAGVGIITSYDYMYCFQADNNELIAIFNNVNNHTNLIYRKEA